MLASGAGLAGRCGMSEPAEVTSRARMPGAVSGPPVLWRLQNVSLSGGAQSRLTGVSLEVLQASTAVIGYSGAGKTSLLNILVGYEAGHKGQLDQFSAWTGLDGQPLRGCGEGRLSGWPLPVYWVPQAGGLWPHLTVRDHLLVVQAGGRDRRRHEIRASSAKRADEILARLDLNHRADARPGELSQGEQSRLSVARGVMSGACVLLMDEPLSHVDPVRKPGYWDVLCEYAERAGTTLIFSCHEAEILLRHAERVIGLRGGGVWYTGTVRELYECPPEADLGRFAGRLNWFSAGEREELGLSRGGDSEGASRPEWIDVESVSEGLVGVEVLRTRVCGGMSETDVRVGSGELRILHRSPRMELRQGMRIVIREQTARERGRA